MRFCYEKVHEMVAKGHQVMVFVHAPQRHLQDSYGHEGQVAQDAALECL